MPRQKRATSDTGIYHICIRGINQQPLFEKSADYERFLEILLSTKEQSGFILYAYCLMPNHVHLLLKEGEEPLATAFKRLGTRYVQWFNREYERTGHLFQDRFFSEPVESDEYFYAALFYIYQNPVKAKLCKTPADYEWSSRRYTGKMSPLIDREALEKICPASLTKRREHELVEHDLLDEKKIGRRRAFSDKAVVAMLSELTGTKSTAGFQGLSLDEKKAAAGTLRSKGVPFRQIARVMGASKGSVEYWCKG